MNMIKQLAYIKSPHEGYVHGRAFTTEGEVYKTPKAWLGRVVRFYAVDGSARFITGAHENISITDDAVSGYNTETKELEGNNVVAPLSLKDWSFTDYFFVDGVDLYFCIKSTDVNGYWYGHPADHSASVPL